MNCRIFPGALSFTSESNEKDMPDDRISPARLDPGLDSPLRSLLHPPKRIVGPYLRPGGTALYIGCGSAFFTRAMARMVGTSGKFIAVDI